MRLEEKLVWYYVDQDFRQVWKYNLNKIKHLNEYDWKSIFYYAFLNRVLYYFCEQILSDNQIIERQVPNIVYKIIEKGKKHMHRIHRTLQIIKDVWEDSVDYYLIKTAEPLPIHTYDIDVLFVDQAEYKQAIRMMQNKGFIYRRDEPYKGSILIKGGIKIELHLGISWFGMRFLDNEIFHINPRKVRLMDLEFKVPSSEAELAINLAHMIFDVHPLTIRDFIVIKSLTLGISDWGLIIQQARKYKWYQALLYYLSIIKALYRQLYRRELCLPIKTINVRVKPIFPYWYPLGMRIKFVSQKTSNIKTFAYLLVRYTYERIHFNLLKPLLLTKLELN